MDWRYSTLFDTTEHSNIKESTVEGFDDTPDSVPRW